MSIMLRHPHQSSRKLSCSIAPNPPTARVGRRDPESAPDPPWWLVLCTKVPPRGNATEIGCAQASSAQVLFGCELWPPHRRQSVLPGRAKETTSLRQTFLPTSSRPFGDYWRRRASTYDSLPTIFTRPAADPSPKQLDGVPTTSCVPFHFTFYLLIWLVVSHPSWTRRFSREASTNSRPPQAAKLAHPPRACPHAHREACPASA